MVKRTLKANSVQSPMFLCYTVEYTDSISIKRVKRRSYFSISCHSRQVRELQFVVSKSIHLGMSKSRYLSEHARRKVANKRT